MKTLLKILFTTCLLICVSQQMEAQKQEKAFTSDIHLGVNIATMDIAGANMYKEPKFGANIGVNFNYKILQNIQVQTGLYVTKKGIKQHIETDYIDDLLVRHKGDTVRNTTASYIQVPFALGYELYLTKQFAFNVNGGMYVAYGFKGKNKVQAYAETIIDGTNITKEPPLVYEEETFALQRFNRLDYGAIASVGFIYDIYTLNFNYEYGMHNVSDDGRVLKNRNISILLGFRF